MRISDISMKNLQRRKGRAAFLLAGLSIGISTVVAIISFVSSVTSDINEKIEKFGADILIVPKTENLTLISGAFLLAVAIGLTASIYPALVATSMDPNEALRAL
jgi:putative ABC transport system permease protein